MINSVRNTVLSILNKNNYGYISPSDFNLFALQAQMEIFDEYMSNYNKTINAENARMSGVDYANIRRNIEESLEIFAVSNFLSNYRRNTFYLPSLTTTGDEDYVINKILCYYTILKTGTNTSVVANQLVDTAGTFVTLGIKEGDIVSNTTTGKVTRVSSVTSETVIVLDDNYFLATPNNYTIIDGVKFTEVEKVTHNKITMLLNSTITLPSVMFPSYSQEADKLTVFPSTIRTKGQLLAEYFRTPKAPKWTYISLTNGEPAFDQTQSDYQDFELPSQSEYAIVVKILEYCGISIRETEVANFAIGAEQREQPTFSSKQ